MNELKWLARPILAGLALTFWAITFWGTGEMPPAFLTSLVVTAWSVVFVSREKEKANAQKSL